MSEINETSDYERGFQDGRNFDAGLTIGRAKSAYDELCAEGRKAQADAMQAEISRLQSIVCSACEASMDSGHAREAAEAAVARMEGDIAKFRELAHFIVSGAVPATTSGATCFVPRYQIDELRALLEGRRYSEDEHG